MGPGRENFNMQGQGSVRLRFSGMTVFYLLVFEFTRWWKKLGGKWMEIDRKMDENGGKMGLKMKKK
jgi:hypothetical protein